MFSNATFAGLFSLIVGIITLLVLDIVSIPLPLKGIIVVSCGILAVLLLAMWAELEESILVIGYISSFFIGSGVWNAYESAEYTAIAVFVTALLFGLGSYYNTSKSADKPADGDTNGIVDFIGSLTMPAIAGVLTYVFLTAEIWFAAVSSSILIISISMLESSKASQ